MKFSINLSLSISLWDGWRVMNGGVPPPCPSPLCHLRSLPPPPLVSSPPLPMAPTTSSSAARTPAPSLTMTTGCRCAICIVKMRMRLGAWPAWRRRFLWGWATGRGSTPWSALSTRRLAASLPPGSSRLAARLSRATQLFPSAIFPPHRCPLWSTSQVAELHQFRPLTAYLAVNYMDRFLSRHVLPVCNLHSHYL